MKLETGIDVVTSLISTIFLIVRAFNSGLLRLLPLSLVALGIFILAGVIIT